MSSTVIFVGLPENSKSSVIKTVSEAESLSNLVRSVDLESSAVNTNVERVQRGGLDTVTGAMRLCSEKPEIVAILQPRIRVDKGVPNAPKSCIAEIFNGDVPDGTIPMKNGSSRSRTVCDTPTRPRDTHSRLFGQGGKHSSVAPMITDTIRSNIHFGDSEINGVIRAHAHKMNGSASSTPSRGEMEHGDHLMYTPPKRNPVTGDGVAMPPTRRRHPAANLREGNPITGDGYKSMNGQINTVTSVNGNSNILHNRVPPGGYSSGLW